MNKLTKLLSVFIIAGAVGASVAGVSACKKKGHTHSVDLTKSVDNGDGTHDVYCGCGHLMFDDDPHSWDDNGICTKCGNDKNAAVPGTVSLDTTESSSQVGRVFEIVATISNAGELTDAQKVLTWEVEDPTVARISQSSDTRTATVTCLKVGHTKITVSTVNHNTAEYNLTVTNNATGIKITDEAGTAIDRISLTPASGDIVIKAAIQPAGSSDTEVLWESSNPAVATVTPDANDSTKATVHMASQGDAPILITATVKGRDSVKKSIFCTADTYYGSLIQDTEHLIINENFSSYETGAILEKWGGDWGAEAGVFGSCNGKGTPASSYNEANNVTIVTEAENNNNNRAQMNDTTGGGTEVIVDFGAVDGVVKGYTNIKFVEYGTSWTFAQIHGKDKGKPDGGEILGLRAYKKDSSTQYIRVRVNGAEQDGLVTNISPATGGSLRLYYEIDIKNDTAVVYLNGVKFYEATAGTLGITELYGVRFTSSDNEAKRISVDNIAVTHVGVDPATVKADLLAKLDTEYGTYKEVDYNADKWTELTTAYNTAKTAINGAGTDKAAMNAAYKTAVDTMKAVPTKAGEELAAAKAAYKDKITEAYPEADYTYNATAYKAAYDALMAAIDNYNGEVGDEALETGLYGDNAIKTAGNALEAVKNDTDAMTAAKTDYKAEIAEAYPAGSYTVNATEYNAAYDAVIKAIEDYDGAIADIKTDTSIAGLIETLAAVETDAQALAAAKTAAKTEIANYKTDVVAAFAPNESANITQTVVDDAKVRVTAIRNRRSEAVDVASTIDRVLDEVALAKKNIDSFDNAFNGTATLAEFKTAELAILRADIDAAKADVDADDSKTEQEKTQLKNSIEAVYESTAGVINGSTLDNKVSVALRRVLASMDLNVMIEKLNAYAEIELKANEAKDEIISKAAVDEITALIKYNTSAEDREQWSNEMWAIHNASQISGVVDAKNVVLDAIDAIVTKYKAESFTVTLGTTGETLSVQWGTEVKLGDLFATAFKVTAAEYNGTAITAEAGVTVYDDITITVTLEEIEGFAPSADWKVVANATAPTTGVVIDNALFSITAPEGTTYGAANSGFTNVCGEANALHYIVPKATLEGGKVSVKGDNKDNPYEIKVKSSLAKLDIYVSLSDSKGSGDRTGSIYYSVDGGLTYKTVDGVKNKTIALTDVAAGTVIKIYADNSSIKSSDGSAMDARLYLAKVEAAVDEEKVAKTVQITWKGAGVDGADIVENYHYYDKITAPAHQNLSGTESVDYWHLEGADTDKWVDETTLHGGKYVYVAKLKTVAAVQTVTLTAAAEIELGSTLELIVAATDTEGGDGLAGREVSWSVTGKAEVKEVEGKYVLSLTEGAAAGDTVKVKATVGGVDSEVKTITVKAATQEGWKKDFSSGAPSSNLSYNTGDKIDADKTATGGGTYVGAIEVTDSTSSKCNWNKGGYFKGSQNAVISITTKAAASLIIVDANSNSARSYTVKDSTGKVIKTHTMNNGSETITLEAAGTYTISFAGGECRIKSIELKPL